MHKALRDKAVDIIERCRDMTIATNREDGFPQATVVSFVNDGLTLFFGCGANSQKARNLARDPRVSVAMTEPYDAWSGIRGVSMGAKARAVTASEEIDQVAEMMAERFPQIEEIELAEPDTVKLYRLTPLVISVLDYTEGFGRADTVTVTDNDIAETLESMAHRWLARSE